MFYFNYKTSSFWIYQPHLYTDALKSLFFCYQTVSILSTIYLPHRQVHRLIFFSLINLQRRLKCFSFLLFTFLASIKTKVPPAMNCKTESVYAARLYSVRKFCFNLWSMSRSLCSLAWRRYMLSHLCHSKCVRKCPQTKMESRICD